MKPSSCPRLWEADAVEDGRLDATACASFERHLLVCPSCARARVELEGLQTMADQLASPMATELDRKRLRAAILREANQRLLVGSSRDRRRPFAVAAFLVLATVVGLVAGRRALRVAPPLSSAQPIFEIVPVGIAEWHVDQPDEHVMVTLRNGTVAIHVAKLGPKERFVLIVPDGEIEVRGTRFVTRVDSGHARNVSVSDGVVALRLQGSAEQILGAGQTWSSAPPKDLDVDHMATSTLEPSSEPTSPRPVRGERVAPSPARSGSSDRGAPGRPDLREATRIKKQPPSAAGVSSAPTDSDSPGATFQKAMGAFSTGAYETADGLLAEFQGRFPHDARSEDAAFLRVVTQQRAGNARATRDRAREYQRLYPNGFHRTEIDPFLSETTH